MAIVKRDGFEIWNNLWYGGHHTLGYGVLFPLLGATLGIWTVTVLSSAASAFLADLLLRQATGRRCLMASMWFAVGTVTNVAVGRLPFALGLAVALGALVAAQRRWIVLTAVLTVATAAASPVVSAFLALVFLAWAWSSAGRDRRRFVGLSVLSMAPVLLVAAFYPQGGAFPFRWPALLLTLGTVAWVLVFVPVQQRLIRAAAVLYAIAAVIAFVVPTPLGANLNRFGMYAAGPALLAVMPMRRMLALVIPWLLFWQWSPALDAMLRAGRDPSTQEDYYRPLIGYLSSVGAETGRLEIVPTGRHWEAGYVASRFPIARGWERQLDIRFNSLFYEEGLTAAEYHRWLLESGVDRVAVPDALLDDSGVEEAALIAGGLTYLRPAWANGDWHVYDVVDATGLIDGPAEVVTIDIDSVTLDVHRSGDVVVRMRESPFWVTDPVLCVEPTDDGWIVVRDAPVGELIVRLDETEPLADDACAPL